METKTGIKPYSNRDLSALYHLSPKALRQMLEPHKNLIGKKLRNHYSILQVEIIFVKLGVPNNLL